MLFGAPNPAKVGLEKAKIKKGRFALRYSFRGAVRPVITGGEFSGPYAFYGAKQAQVKGGEFQADLCFYAAENPQVEAGRFTAKSPLWGSQHSLVTGGEFSGEWALCESRHGVIKGGRFSGPRGAPGIGRGLCLRRGVRRAGLRRGEPFDAGHRRNIFRRRLFESQPRGLRVGRFPGRQGMF